MEGLYQKAVESAAYIKSKLSGVPQIGIILGSGLGPLVNDIQDAVEIDYKEIPNFPQTTVEGHEGKLVSGQLGGKTVLAMKGRFHYYEGYEVAETTFAIRVFKQLGMENLMVTNAAGGINKSFTPGDLMLIKDHIGFLAPSALRGKNMNEFGTRFPDMSQAYDPKLREMAKGIAEKEGIRIKEGIYCFSKGPMYETPAEIRALGILGADAVGMSTVPEVVVARHAGMNVLGISCITNMAAGILDQPLSHVEVMQTAKQVEEKFTKLVKKVVEIW